MNFIAYNLSHGQGCDASLGCACVLTCKTVLLRNVVRSVEWFIDPMFISDTNEG